MRHDFTAAIAKNMDKLIRSGAEQERRGLIKTTPHCMTCTCKSLKELEDELPEQCEPKQHPKPPTDQSVLRDIERVDPLDSPVET
jgi:hypothetical protein